jgi:hypothetical protein
MLLGVLSLRAGNSMRPEAAFRRQIGSAKARGRDCAASRLTMLGDVHAARAALDDALAAYQEAQREVLALLEGDAENVAAAARFVCDVRSRRRRAACQG